MAGYHDRMVHHRRNRIPGASYFFTLTLENRSTRSLVEHIQLLGDSMRKAQQHAPFRVEAIVVLPEHLHAVWTLPDGDANYAARWRAIKADFTHALVRQGTPLKPRPEGGYRLWQRRFWEHTLRDELDVERHIDYIHFNPVKHGLVERAADWPHSSFHRYVREGVYAPDWGMAATVGAGGFGER